MNSCPNCGTTPVTFKEWSRWFNAFKTKCRNCGVDLHCTIKSAFLFVTVFLLIVGGLIVIFYLTRDHDFSGRSAKPLVVLIIVPLYGGLAYRYWVYRTGKGKSP